MTIIEFLKHYWLLFAISIPFFYFIIRDILNIYFKHKYLKQQKKDYIEAEKRMFELVKQSDQNKVDLINKLGNLKKKINKSLSEIDNKLNDEKEKS